MEINQFRDVDLVIDKANDNFIQKQFVSQGDLKGRTLTVQITDRGVIGEVPGLTLNLRWTNTASGLTDLSAFECIDQENSLFRIEYPTNMLTPGKVLANIQVIQNGKITHLKTFELTVQRLSGEMVGVTGQAEYGALVAVLSDANKFRTDIDTLGMDKADKTALAETDAEVAELDSTKASKDSLNTTNQNVEALKNTKVDKNGNEQITLPMLSQEVKTAMTGGSVAVVGVNGIAPSNLQANAATSPKRTVLGEWATIATKIKPNVNTVQRTLEFGNAFTVVIYRNSASGDTFRGTTVEIGASTDDGDFIVYNITTKTIRYTTQMVSIQEDELLLGWAFWNQKQFYFNFEFTVDGEVPMEAGTVPVPSLQPLVHSGQIVSVRPLIVNPKTRSIVFPDAYSQFNYANKVESLAAVINTVWDLSVREANYLAFNTKTKALESISSISGLTKDHVYIGFVNWGSNFAVELNANYVVKGNYGTGSVQKKWSGEDLVAFGDSITWGDNGIGSGGNSVSWVAQMRLKSGFNNVVNKGVSGSRVAVRPGKTDSFVERVGTITGITGVITVWGGINDFHFSTPLGAFSDGDTANFYAAYRYAIETLQTNNPEAKILCITPMKANKFTPTFDAEGNLSVNETGATQLDYVNAIKEVAGYYGVPVLDMYNESNQNPFNEQHATLWFGDGLHPSDAGYLRIADQIASRLEIL